MRTASEASIVASASASERRLIVGHGAKKTTKKTTKATKTTKTTTASIPPRPKQAPEGTEWSEKDKVFRAGPKDAKGREQGLWREWYPGGRVYGEVNS